jgi:hypothetical protein
MKIQRAVEYKKNRLARIRKKKIHEKNSMLSLFNYHNVHPGMLLIVVLAVSCFELERSLLAAHCFV